MLGSHKHSMIPPQRACLASPRRVAHPARRHLAAFARFLHALPASWHVALHALWDGIFGGARGFLDAVWLGADLRPMAAAALEGYHGAGIGRTLVVASGRGTVPACCAMKRWGLSA